ncbi:hypothetical protein E3P92_03605 [Wallemia ichthyophaga]|nr:hypothetical protein E3P92_03605 [Wallemia ichthyophaga]
MSHKVSCEELAALEKLENDLIRNQSIFKYLSRYLDKNNRIEENHSKGHETREIFLRSLEPFVFACSSQCVTMWGTAGKIHCNEILKLIKRKPDYESDSFREGCMQLFPSTKSISFCKDLRSAEKVVEKVSKTQPKALVVYHAHDKEAFDRVDNDELRISFSSDSIPPSLINQKIKLIVGELQPATASLRIHNPGRPLLSAEKAIAITLTSELEMMPLEHLSTLWCHSEGLARLLYSPDGSKLYTAGNDSMLRAFSLNSDQSLGESQVIDAHTDSIQSLDATSQLVITACEDGCVRSFNLSDNSFNELLVKSSLPARWIGVERVRGRAKRIALASDELIVKIVDLNDHLKVSLLQGHTKSVRCATWAPNGGVLATSSADGSIKIWKEKHSQFECIKTIDGIIRADDADSEYGVAAHWHPSGKLIVCTTRASDIAIIDTSTYRKIGSLSHDGHTADVSEVEWSPNGRYLASAGRDGNVLVWSIDDRRVIAKTKAESLVTAFAWHPTENVLSFIDTSSSVTRWLRPVPDAAEPPCGGKVLYGDEMHTANGKAGHALGYEDKESRQDEDTVLRELSELRDGDQDNLDDFAIDGDDKENGDGDGNLDDDEYTHSKRKHTSAAVYDGGQRPFQPGSTPLRVDRRYLAFNMVGVVHAVDQDTHNLITVEFHDKSAHRGYSFQDHFKSSLCALGEAGAVYASAGAAGAASMVVYKPFDSWSAQQDWSVRLGDGEVASLVACTSSVVVVCSSTPSTHLIRFFTTSGIQRYVLNHGKEMVTASASRQYLIIVSRSTGGAVNGLQNLEYDVMDLFTLEWVQRGAVPLGQGGEIRWLGFSVDVDIPVMFDSNGLLSMLDRFATPMQARWVPLLDTATLERGRDKQERYWPVGVVGNSLQCLILKGREQHPFFPRPLISTLDVRMPVLGLDTQQGQLEEGVLRDSLVLSHARGQAENVGDEEHSNLEEAIKKHELTIDKGLLQLINTACKADRLQRALDAAGMLNQFSSVDAAMKIAAFFHLPSLQDRIYLLKEEKMRVSGRSKGGRSKRINYEERLMSRPLSTLPVGSVGQSSHSNHAPAFPARKPHQKRRFDAPVELDDVDVGGDVTQEVVDVEGDGDEDEPIDFSDDEEEDGAEEGEHAENPTTTSNKRKMDAVDDSQLTFSPPQSSRARLSEEVMAIPPPPIPGMATDTAQTTQSNPFAKSANPFAKTPAVSLTDNKTALKKSSIHQSDSFFERAERPVERSGKAGQSKKKNTNKKQQSSLLSHLQKPASALHERDENENENDNSNE